MNKPLIAVTMGDPAGIGPEVIVKAWSDPRTHQYARPLVIGEPSILERAARLWDKNLEVVRVDSPRKAEPSQGMLLCLAAVDHSAALVEPGRVDARGGEAAYQALIHAAALAKAGEIDAITTAPLSKAALWAAGHRYPGHTELLAELCGIDDFAMMLYLARGGPIEGPAGLGVVHTTLHMALADVFARLTSEEILRKLRLAHQTMLGIKQATPQIVACALNPHAGEEGLFGDEEERLIAPAVQRARDEGIDATGPLPADTALVRAAAGEFDGVVAMYHDQGHIALKLLGMHRAVNVTLGLPIVRTSVAHGTAFDIAWQGRAQASSMVEAIRVASLLAEK